MGNEYGCRFELGEEINWREGTARLFGRLVEASKTDWQLRAQESHYKLYPLLNKQLGNKHYITDSNSTKLIKWVIKVRCNMLNLNFKFWKTENILCPICNLKEEEDMVHFLGKCPIFKNIREKYFCKACLDEKEIVIILNGNNWKKLYMYVKEAWAWRKLIIEEYY